MLSLEEDVEAQALRDQLLSPQALDDLVRTALLVCGGCDMTVQFDIGLDLMIRGLDAYLDTIATDTTVTSDAATAN